MLAANEAVAGALDRHRTSGSCAGRTPTRSPPSSTSSPSSPAAWASHIEHPQSRFELQRVLAEAAGKPEEYAVHYGLLRSLKQASYTPEPEGHYALASEDYCHFTSPIRRYPDLQVHRQLIAWLDGKRPSTDIDELVVLGEHCTRTERRAEAAERELIRIKLLTYLEEHIGESFHAVIVARRGLRPLLPPGRAAGRGAGPRHQLADDYYYLEAGTHTLIGRRSGRRHRLGDREVVRIAHVDVDRRVLDLVLADSPMGQANIRRRGTGRGGSQPGPAPARPDPSTTGARHAGERPPASADDEPSTRPGRQRPPAGGAKKGKIKPKAKAKAKPKGNARKGRKKR